MAKRFRTGNHTGPTSGPHHARRWSTEGCLPMSAAVQEPRLLASYRQDAFAQIGLVTSPVYSLIAFSSTSRTMLRRIP